MSSSVRRIFVGSVLMVVSICVAGRTGRDAQTAQRRFHTQDVVPKTGTEASVSIGFLCY